MQPYEKEAEKKAFKELSTKEKLDHIWTYYKMPIIIGLIALFVLGWGVYRIINPPAIDDGVAVIYYSYDDSNALKELRTGINEHFAPRLDDNHEIAIMSLTNYGDNIIFYEQQMVNSEKIVAMIAAEELDILVACETMINTYSMLDTNDQTASEMLYLSYLSDVFSKEELDYILSLGFAFNEFSICIQGEQTNLYNVMEKNGEVPYIAFTCNCDKEMSRAMAYYFMNIEPYSNENK